MATDEAQAFYDAAYAVVRLIPKGQVTTYGIPRGIQSVDTQVTSRN
jgi:alkylated DNA nucleotide flippase Atl1